MAAASAAGCAFNPKKDRKPDSIDVDESNVYEFIVVGSGAGGGPLASRLAQAGFRVLLIEAGSDDPGLYSRLPVMHAKASEDPRIAWNFFVRRYSDSRTESLNSKFVPGKGIFYPRGSGVGGCTTMNALVNLYLDHQDWTHIRKLTKDDSWDPFRMFEHFERLQVALPDRSKPVWDYFRSQAQRGWLELNQNSISLLFQDKALLSIVTAALRMEGLKSEILQKIYAENLNVKLNPNVRDYVLTKFDGLYNIPVNVKNGFRRGVREFILETKTRLPDKLILKTDCLAKGLIFSENQKDQVIGVEYAEGARLYSAHPNASETSSYSVQKAFASKEVILCGGAFNTPQLLQLSGIGDENMLRVRGIEPRIHLPGVGLNLQDRYEVGVVSKYPKGFKLLANCGFDVAHDACFEEFMGNPSAHLYGTNGVVISMIKRSSSKQPTPDLCVFAVPGLFRGYFPGYSREAYNSQYLTWLVLKGHTKNKAGYVHVKSNNFRDTPEVNFRAFNDGGEFNGEDMQAIIEGVGMARKANSLMPKEMGLEEVLPGPKHQGPDGVREFVKKEAWGHHASCTCPMGPDEDPNAVLDSQFRVRKTKGLRVVDASVFRTFRACSSWCPF